MLYLNAECCVKDTPLMFILVKFEKNNEILYALLAKNILIKVTIN